MTTRQIGMSLAVLVVVLILIAFGATFLPKQAAVIPSPTPTGAVACTMEARMCPDGSYVGRQGPNCEFAMCPVSNASSTQTYRAKLGQITGDTSVKINPTSIVEDSRCPVDVQCIQAGTVRLKIELAVNGFASIETLTLGTPLVVRNTKITLTEVGPVKQSKVTVVPGDYSFTFEIQK